MSAILRKAEFNDVTLEGLQAPMVFGPGPDEAFDFVSKLTGWMREGLDERGRDAALEALRETILDHAGDDGVAYQSATWIIRANKR